MRIAETFFSADCEGPAMLAVSSMSLSSVPITVFTSRVIGSCDGLRAMQKMSWSARRAERANMIWCASGTIGSGSKRTGLSVQNGDC